MKQFNDLAERIQFRKVKADSSQDLYDYKIWLLPAGTEGGLTRYCMVAVSWYGRWFNKIWLQPAGTEGGLTRYGCCQEKPGTFGTGL